MPKAKMVKGTDINQLNAQIRGFFTYILTKMQQTGAGDSSLNLVSPVSVQAG